MDLRRLLRTVTPVAALVGTIGLTGTASAASATTNLQETNPVVWAMLAISIGGALITFGILVYALWKFRDPTTRGRRYG